MLNTIDVANIVKAEVTVRLEAMRYERIPAKVRQRLTDSVCTLVGGDVQKAEQKLTHLIRRKTGRAITGPKIAQAFIGEEAHGGGAGGGKTLPSDEMNPDKSSQDSYLAHPPIEPRQA